MNSRVHARQQAQLAWDISGQNLIVGQREACPLPPEVLATLTAASPYVIQSFGGGLTAQVLRLSIDGREYTLKQKRAEARVQNIDGQTSFLNEVQRRADFTRLKADPVWAARLQHIVPTLYADYRLGIILSPWLPGAPLARFDTAIFRQILQTVVTCEEAGLMEWDLCPGNIIDDDGHVWLFDFGYMYPFDPLREFNSNGLSDPLFHACERFETRNFFGWLLKQSVQQPNAESLALFRALKEVAVEVYQHKLCWLQQQEASAVVCDWVRDITQRWQAALVDDEALAALFEIEYFRSQVLDIEDDLHGKSCTELTLRRFAVVEQCLQQRYAALQQGGALFYDNAGKSQAELLTLYRHKRALAEQYQLR
ncbi:hypothetical protein ACFOSS_15435 [Pseudaeromonas sharmana]|uniref:Phosphotransferase n=1 Tax=Pseudaeromonas sharmana TaxID=328412 RepID=A0ABV8CSS8_9GAMM